MALSRFERILTAAANSKPSQAQLDDWKKRDEENARFNSYDHTHPSKTSRTALTGWTGRTLDIEDVQWSPGYAEPGYDDPKHDILFANWNDVSKRVYSLLERAGYACEWQDEWSTCSECGKAVRTSADSYGWQQSFWMPGDSGVLLCNECIDPAEYLKYLENRTSSCSTLRDIDPADHGYVKLQGDFENGFHPGQNDDPKKIYSELRANGETRPLIFVLDGVGQFDMEFSVWAKLEDEDEQR
jgi:hypothetical protein